MILVRFVVSVLAIFLILFGIFAAVTPIPFGVIMMIAGIMILAVVVPQARPLLKWLRRRFPWLNRKIYEYEEEFPKYFKQALRESDPGSLDDK